MGEEIIKVLDTLCNKFGIAVDWSSKNIMPYINELAEKVVKWEICTSIMWVMIGILLCLSTIAWWKAAKYAKKRYDEEGEFSDWNIALGLLLAGLLICAAVGLCVIMKQAYDIITCIALPEKIVVDLLKDYISAS